MAEEEQSADPDALLVAEEPSGDPEACLLHVLAPFSTLSLIVAVNKGVVAHTTARAGSEWAWSLRHMTFDGTENTAVCTVQYTVCAVLV